MALLKTHIADEMDRLRGVSQGNGLPLGAMADPEMFESRDVTFNATSTTLRFDKQNGVTPKRLLLTLTDNLTACVIRCPSKDSIFQAEFKQDSTGSRTIPTPTALASDGSTAVTIHWIGAAFMTESTTAAYRDTVTFRYDVTNKILREIRRNIGYAA